MILAPIQTLVAEIGSMFGSREERPATIMGTIGVQLATPTGRGLLNRSGFVLLCVILSIVLKSWAVVQCESVEKVYIVAHCCGTNCNPYPNCYPGYLGICRASNCPDTLRADNGYYVNVRSNNGSYECYAEQGCKYLSYCYDVGCGQNDTTWTEISCAYSPQRGQYLNVVNTYSVVNCSTSTRSSQYYSAQCDSAGADTNITCLGSFDGVHVQLRGSTGKITICAADGSCDMALRKVAIGECNNPNPPRPSSSASGESSSSEGEPTSSDSGAGSSSEGEDTSGVSTHVIVDELPLRLYDSLGHIDYNIEIMQPFVSGIYDATYEMLGNQYDMKENQRQGLELLGDIRDATEGANTKLSTTNSLLTDIKNKNWNPSINVQNTTDVSGIQNRQDQTRDTLHNTNSLLEQIKGLLGSSGSDTIHVDTSKAPASIDSALKFWGNSANRTFSNAGLDTSTWGNANDSAAFATDSALAQGTWTTVMNCDTTGGRKCDSGIIGEHGLDSAASGLKSAYAALGDTLRNGAFGDSLSQWGSKFTGGVITGSGSGNCPAVLSRSYHVDIIGDTGFDMEIGYFLCRPVFGNVTPWALCRLLLRASIALACMWFLFKCATGFKGQGEED